MLPIDEGNPNNSFDRDLEDGEKLERIVLHNIKTGNTPLFREAFPDAYKVEGYFKAYDIFVPGVDIRIEVKKDVKSQETGNYVIEVEFGGKPSALSTTEADYWVFWDCECWIYTTVPKIKDAVKGLPLREFTAKGDTTPKKAYLCPKERIKSNAEYIVY